MVLETLKNQRTFQSSISFLGQFFHENHLFFDAFEIVTRTNGFFILIFFPKHHNHRKLEVFKDLELAFLKKFKELPNINPYNVYK
jgi:hypothetical protein